MNNSPLISVLMSTHNATNTIEKAVKSIQTQTYNNLEILIIDDGSTDGTHEILKKMAYKDSRIKIIKNEINIGLTRSLNILINSCTGSIIARQDADDSSLPQRIETQLKVLQRYSLDFCSTRAIVKNSKKRIPKFSYYLPKKQILKLKNPFIHGTLMIRKNILLEVGGYDEKFYYAQDYKLMKKLITENYNYRMIKSPLYILNTENNISTLKKNEQKKYANDVKRGK
jgi:glycosyltransferase involved in cell wall biosynthesis